MNISVVINTYNGAGMLESALRSVEAQVFQPSEIVIVDDGSTDDTEATLQKLAAAGKRFTLLQKPHTQLADSRNFAIRHTSGSHIAFLDVDDVWSPAYLREAAAAFEKHPQAEVVCADGFAVRETTGRAIRPLFPPEVATLAGRVSTPLALFEFFPCPTPSGTIASRAAYERIGTFATEFPLLGHDWDWLIRAANAGAFIITIRKPLVIYVCDHGSNLSRAYDTMFEAWIRIYSRLRARLGDDPLLKQSALKLTRSLASPLPIYPRRRSNALLSEALVLFPGDPVLRALRTATWVGAAPFRLARAVLRGARRIAPSGTYVDLAWPPERIFSALDPNLQVSRGER